MDEEIKTEKQPWQKPELVVLVRSKPEEAVLTTCKFTTSTASAAQFNLCAQCVTSLLS